MLSVMAGGMVRRRCCFGNLELEQGGQIAGRHHELTTVCSVVTVESEGVRAELAMYARRGHWCFGADKVVSAHRRRMPWPNKNEHRIEEVNTSSETPTI